MLKALLKSRGGKALGAELCAETGAQARKPVFFTALGVPDTIDGRFDMVVLHAWLVLERLRELEMKDVSQAMIDNLFVSFDESLRDLGVGDIGIGHRVKKMADAFYGRLSAYGTSADDGTLKDAILRNIYRGEAGRNDQASALANYALTVRAKLRESDLSFGLPDLGTIPTRTR